MPSTRSGARLVKAGRRHNTDRSESRATEEATPWTGRPEREFSAPCTISKPALGERIETTCPIFDKPIDATYRRNRSTGECEWFVGGHSECIRELGGAYLGQLAEALDLERGASKEEIVSVLIAREGVATTNARREPEPLPSASFIDGAIANLHSANGAAAMEWLVEERGLIEETIERYRLGYSERRDFGAWPNLPAVVFPVFDADGELVNVRLRFWPTVPTAASGKPAKMVGLKGRPAELWPDVPAGRSLLVCEGELDALRLRQEGFPAVTSTAGTSWAPEWHEHVRGRRVAILYDAGSFELASRRAEELREAGAREAWPVDLAIYGMERGEDATDCLDLCGPDALRSLLNKSRCYWQQWASGELTPGLLPGGTDIAASAAPKKRAPTQAQRLIALAHRDYDIVSGPEGRQYAVPKRHPREALPLTGRGALTRQLTLGFFRLAGSPPNPTALRGAIEVLSAQASASASEPTPVHLRACRSHGGGLVIDLADKQGRAVLVEPGRWRVAHPPDEVIFRRTRLTHALPAPKRGGRLDGLRELLSLSDDAWALVRAWLVMAWMPDFPVPILGITGRQGAGKSLLGRALVQLVDPSPAPLRSMPRDLSEWQTAANASRVIGLDNISRISDDMSDAFCRAVTGEGVAKRQLYEDEELIVQSFRRAIVLTYIDPGSIRGDFGERLLSVELASLNGRRRGEREIDRELTRRMPSILGGLCELIAQVLATPVELPAGELGRMADAEKVMASIDAALRSDTLGAYRRSTRAIVSVVLDGDPVSAALIEFMAGGVRADWTGTATELDRELRPLNESSAWPGNAAKLVARLKRIAPALEDAHGLNVSFRRGDRKMIELRWARATRTRKARRIRKRSAR